MLDPDFRVFSIGKAEIDHIASGRLGDSHVLYQLPRIELLMYATGRIDVDIDKFDPGKSKSIDKLTNEILSKMRRATRPKLDFDMDAILHTDLVDPVLKKFLSDNVRFSPTAKFKRAFRNYKGVKSFILGITDTFDLVFTSPNHLDFTYNRMVRSSSRQSSFVTNLVKTGVQYIESIMRQA